MFEQKPLEEVLGGERRVALEFGASWCSMCHDLEARVLDTARGRAIFDGVETLAVDFDSAPELGERFAILELPTLVVLKPDGLEVGRVVGFDDPEAWVARAQDALVAEDPVPGLREEAQHGDPRILVALGEALLSRAPEEGLAFLERASWDTGGAGAHALWVLGRYQHRVKDDPAAARFLWQQLATRSPRGDHGAWWWYAKAQAALGRTDLGSYAYAVRLEEDPDNAEAIADWARFAGRHGYDPARAAIREVAMRALGRARGADRERLETLVMDLSRPF